MTIFLSHVAADAEAAQGLEKYLERRGHFVEMDDGETALRPLQQGDVAVLLVSQQLTMSLYRLRLEQRALDAWADGRLVLVQLDKGFAPVGLRDLPAIDASFEAKREFTWGEVTTAIQRAMAAPARPHTDAVEAGDGAGAAPPTAAKKRGGGFGWLFAILLMLPGVLALLAVVMLWLTTRDLAGLPAGLDSLGAQYGLPPGVGAFAATGAVVLLVVMLVIALWPKKRRTTVAANRAPTPASAAPSNAVFISYARANKSTVMPLIEAAKQAGKRFWLDQQSTRAGDGWAGEIVRAIRGAPEVVVMCSNAAFESDHVKREIYLADRYKKRLLPVFIEEAQPPEDFEYFFAGVQWLKLFETPEAERPAALMRVLEAA